MRTGLYRWATKSGAQGTARLADLGPAWVPVAGDGRYGAMLMRREDGMTFEKWWERTVEKSLIGKPSMVEHACVKQAWRCAQEAMRERAEGKIHANQRHVAQSPGVGADAQRYALAVCQDILSDVATLPIE